MIHTGFCGINKNFHAKLTIRQLTRFLFGSLVFVLISPFRFEHREVVC